MNEPIQLKLALGAFLLGGAFGFLAQVTGFCTMGAVADVVSYGSWRRARAWMLAVAVATLGTEALRRWSTFDPFQSIYLAPQLSWAGALIGGAMLGFGMVLAGGCISRNLVRFGSGDLRAAVVLMVLGVFAYMTLHGLTAVPRVALERATNLHLGSFGVASQGLPELAQRLLAASAPGIGIRTGFAALTAVALAAACFLNAEFRRSRPGIVAGLGVGLAVTLGWWISAVLAYDEFEPSRPVSLTFTAPVGNSIVYLMTFTGSRLDFGICAVGGTVAGSAAAAFSNRVWALKGFADLPDLLRNLGGAALMGMGGVLALGCTVGQGITGLSTLAAGSVLATAAIVAGAVVALRFLERRA